MEPLNFISFIVVCQLTISEIKYEISFQYLLSVPPKTSFNNDKLQIFYL